MKIDSGEEGNIEITEIFNPVILKSDFEKVTVCFRAGVIEFGVWREDKNMRGWDWWKIDGGEVEYLSFKPCV